MKHVFMVFSPTNQPQIFNSPNSSPERHHGWLFNRDPPPGFRIQWIPRQGIQDGLEMSWAQQGQQVLCLLLFLLLLLLLLLSSSSCSLQATQNTNSPTRMFRPFEDNHHDAIHLEGGSPQHINDRGAEIAQGGLEQFTRTLAVPLWLGGGSGRTRSPKKR